MATPTRSQNISTPKAHLSTPSRLMASPRPGTASAPASNRPLAHKSPAVKTPASTQGHAHHVSVSSQPSSTPLAAAIHDDLLALNSPAAALMSSFGPSGLTPLGGHADGLGITASMNGAAHAMSNMPLSPETERLARAHLIADLLRTRIAGRGITRQGVERTAQLHGLEALWENNVLTVAGNTVDLEITFDSLNSDLVKIVSLKLLITETDDPQSQPQGTAILQSSLAPSKVQDGVVQWNDLTDFNSNLRYLGSLDKIKLKGGVTCFAAVTDLFNAFQKVWDAETDRLSLHSTSHHIRRGSVGRPSIDRPPHLGISLDFWCHGHRLPASASENEQDLLENESDLFTARISCEAGDPPTALTADWVSNQVLSIQARADALLDADADALMPDWQDPATGATQADSGTKADDNDMDMDKPTQSSVSFCNMHFVCWLSPVIHLPLNVAAGLNVGVPMLDIQQAHAITYEKALQKKTIGRLPDNKEHLAEMRWSRTFPMIQSDADGVPRTHSYGLRSPQNGTFLWCYPVKSLKFTHPRQLTTALPVLRQYALLWSILLSLVEHHASSPDKSASAKNGSKDQDQMTHPRPLVRSNIPKPKQEQLGSSTNGVASSDILSVDVSLDVISDPSKTRVDVIIPLHGAQARRKRSPFILLSFNVCLGGTLEIKSLSGVGLGPSTDRNLEARVLQVLTTTEDIGLVVEWLLLQHATSS
ncbi:hypothetical protein B0A52_08296 [Exophiala mesophila]|uniref:Mediator of RNA polymerase II transcription subunit 1 n=1 Tax=Exophiala mesophila TaxID=212818 RepID=A0A438MW15_EXOME|nr:hypothetical protein B0A52_08296 [Exophiala mesophila]